MVQQRHYLKIVILSFFFASSSTYAMFESLNKRMAQWHERIEQEKKQEKEEAEKRKKLKTIKQLTTITAVDHEIDMIKNLIYDERLKELERITGQSYDTLKRDMDHNKNAMKERLQEKPTNFRLFMGTAFSLHTHDPKISLPMYQDLCKSISEEGIDPKNINIIYNSNSTCAASATDLTPLPTITIHSPLLHESEFSQKFVYKHELSHILLLHHSCSQSAYITTLNEDNIKALQSIHEREANIHAASKNSHIAHAGMQRECMYDGHTRIIDNQNHCKEMQIIYELIKRKEQLS
jgi:hypothetical protein